ncbi:MAG: 2-hydroxyacid dehydrogenase [Thermoplasmata archaeon]
MKYLTIIPSFIPAEEIKATVSQILPEMQITTDSSFGSSDVEVLVVTTFTAVPKEMIDRMPNLKFVQVASTGYDNVDVEYLKKKNIMLCNIPIANKESVAEHVIAMTLSLLKDLKFLDHQLRSKNWPLITGSMDLMGKVVGIVGMGKIGVKLVERLIPFEVGIIYYDINRLPEEQEEALGIQYKDIEYLLKNSDIISLHLPLTEKTNHMFSDHEFSIMKDGAIFINTARGEIVDEKALIKAIKTKGLKAGLDVYNREPPDFESELFKLDNVLFSPHIAGVTVESQRRFLTETISNVLRYSQGIEPQFRVI